MVMNVIVRIAVMTEMLIGDLLFFYPYAKRSRFLLRYLCSFAVCLLISFATAYLDISGLSETVVLLIQTIITFLLTLAVYWFSFNLKFKITLALCCSGYALEHMVFQISELVQNMPGSEAYTEFMTTWHIWIEIAFFVVLYILFGVFGAKRIAKLDIRTNYNVLLNGFAIFIVLVCVILSIFSGQLNATPIDSAYAIICCFFALMLQYAVVYATRMSNENEQMKEMEQQDMVRYESMKDAVDFINIKCHDIKKQINNLSLSCAQEDLTDLKEAIELYDISFSTGNTIVDTILTNATVHWATEGVRFTFSGDVSALDYMESSDLKSLILNIVTNAGEACLNVEKDKRCVSVMVENKGEIVIITEINYYSGPVITAGTFPKSTKTTGDPREHGLGLKSMDMIARKYSGHLTAAGDGEKFTLTVVLYKPET